MSEEIAKVIAYLVGGVVISVSAVLVRNLFINPITNEIKKYKENLNKDIQLLDQRFEDYKVFTDNALLIARMDLKEHTSEFYMRTNKIPVIETRIDKIDLEIKDIEGCILRMKDRCNGLCRRRSNDE